MTGKFVFWILLCLNSYSEYCGSASFPHLIIGGEPANITNFPYQLSMEVFNGVTYVHSCGASIIRRSWAITAAHCVYWISKAQMRLRSGSSYTTTGGTLHYAEKIIIHPDYYLDAFLGTDYDVAIIKVSTPFHYSDVDQKISLASETPPAGTQAVVSGWGGVKDENQAPYQLQIHALYTMEYEECRKTYLVLNIYVSARMLCARVPQGQNDVFRQDSGGPLVADNQLVGIVALMAPEFRRYPRVYTDVAKILTWVTITIRNESIGEQLNNLEEVHSQKS